MTTDLRRVTAWLKGKRVAVLKGGWSRERPISLKTGAAVEASLRRLNIRFESIDVTPGVLARLARSKPDLCFIALHGAFGEDGRLQGALDILGIPYTGCGALSSGLAMDKIASKRLFLDAKVPTPAWTVIDRLAFSEDRRAAMAPARRLLSKANLFVKPFDQGSAIGASRVARAADLERAVATCLKMSDKALVEAFVGGRELTVGILGNETLPIVEIVPEHAFYDFHSKYARGGSRHLVPAPIGLDAARRTQDAAFAAYKALGCETYGRVDVLLDRKGRPWVLEVNTIPGMTETSLLPDAARAAGMSFDDLVLKIIQYSLDRRRRRK